MIKSTKNSKKLYKMKLILIYLTIQPLRHLMQYSRFLLCLSLISVAYTSAGQVSTEQRVQQLKDSWYQNLHKLHELGDLIAEKNNRLKALHDRTELAISNYITKKITEAGWFCDSEKVKEEINIQFKNATAEFSKKLFNAIRDEVNVKNFIIRELLPCLEADILLDKNTVAFPVEDTGPFIDIIKFNLIQSIIESNMIKKLLSDYEELLQKIADIDKEIVSLGYPRLLQN